MKFTILIASSALLTLVSCAKNYSCDCTTSINVPAYVDNGITLQEESSTPGTPTTKYVNGKKKDAEKTCTDFGPTLSYNLAPGVVGADSTSIVATCTLGAKL